MTKPISTHHTNYSREHGAESTALLQAAGISDEANVMGGNVSANSNEKSDQETINPKKRVRNESIWGKNKKKKLVNTGQAYKTQAGKEVKPKIMGKSCGARCRHRCSERISEEQRCNLFSAYYELGDKTRQRDYLSKCMLITSPRKYRKDCSRSLNFAYYLYVEDNKVRECKLFLKKHPVCV